MHSRAAVYAVLLVVLAAGSAFAGAPQERVRRTVEAVATVLNDPQLQGAGYDRDRRARVAKIIHESFDFRTMARDCLGPHWEGLTTEQHDGFVGLFGELFERSYDRLVLRFLGDSSTTYGAESLDGDHAVVRANLVRNHDDELPVDYRLVSNGGVWQISDVVVDGVSLAANFRSQFDKTIRASSYDTLVQRITTKLADGDK